MKKTTLLLLLFCLVFTLTACSCEHEWQDATCEVPKTCSLCQKTEGEPLGHSWQEATCETARSCSACGLTEGTPLGHEWQNPENNCFQICSVCGATGELQREHQWEEATCTQPKTCTVCGTTEGECSPHMEFAHMNTAGERIQIRCECGAEESLSAQELMLRMLKGKWTLMAVQVGGQYYLPEPQTNWEEGTWLEFPSDEEPYGYQAGVSDQEIPFVIPHTLSDFQAGGVRFYSNGKQLPIVQCAALPESSDGASQPVLLRLVLGIRGYNPESFDIANFITSALDGYVTCLWRYTEDTTYLYALSSE